MSTIFRFTLAPRLGVLLCVLVFARVVIADTSEVRQARELILAGQNLRAAKILRDTIQTLSEGSDKDVARLLYQQATQSAGHRETSSVTEVGAVTSNASSVEAEKLRVEIADLQTHGARADIINKSLALLKRYPDEFSDIDLFYAIKAAADLRGASQADDLLTIGEKRFANSSIFLWARTMQMHWSNDAPQGIALLTQAESKLEEPLLSAVRARKMIFISGNVDDPHQLDHAKETALQILLAGQLDLRGGFLSPLATLLRKPEHPEGMADWLWQTAADIKDGASAQAVRNAAVVEYLSVGKPDLARANVEKLQQAAVDDPIRKSARQLSDFLDGTIWKLSGSLPPIILSSATNWKVTAILPQQDSAEGKILISTAGSIDSNGHFMLDLAGPRLIALIASGDGTNGILVVRKLSGDFSPGRKKNVQYPQDILPEPTPAASAIPHLPQAMPGETIIPMVEHFGGIWPKQLVKLTISHNGPVHPSALRVCEDNGTPICCQYFGSSDAGIQIGFWRNLKSDETAYLHVKFDAALPLASPRGKVTFISQADGTQIVDTGAAQFRIPAKSMKNPPATSVAFIQAIKGPDDRWRGKAEWNGNATVSQFNITPGLTGPIRTSLICDYAFSNGAKRRVTLSFDVAQPYMLIDEQGTGNSPGDYVFHLDPLEGFDTFLGLKRPGHWTEPLVARSPVLGMYLKDYPYFTSSGNAMLGGFMSAGQRAKDVVSMFVVHPGDWFDPSYTEALTPLNDNPDAPWDHPGRYTGSTHSAIQMLVEKDHDAPVHIPLAPGIRRWGIAVTNADSIQDLDWNIETILHSLNNGDLSRYLQMSFDWNESNDSPLRQEILTHLKQLRAAPLTGLLAKAAKECTFDWLHQTTVPRMVLGIIHDDPVMVYTGWEKTLARMQVYSNGCADMQTQQSTAFDPVGARAVSECYLDYLLADQVGLVDDATRAQIQRISALIAYHQLTPDYMNFKENDGQPNFEADRLLQLAAFVAAFPHHPMAAAIRDHVLMQTAEMLRQWTILDGGKWGENIGAYYLHSLNCVSRLVYFLHFSGSVDPIVNAPSFEPFCRFAANMLMAPQPAESAWLKSDSVPPSADSLRREPGIGSHGGEGGNFVTCPPALMAQVIKERAPTTAKELLSVWNACGNNMGDGWGDYAAEFLLFGRDSYDSVPPISNLLSPKRLPGWGMIMRDKVGSNDEFYLAFHAGTVAYRDANYGSGIILHALGRPLSLDGGDTFLPSDRSTLGFEVKPGVQGFCPLGKVTRWLVSDAVQFARGEFQTANNPDHFSRDVLFARGAQYVVIHDEQTTRWRGIFNFATPAVSAEQRPQGIFCSGKLGVNLWITPLADNLSAATIATSNYGNERITAPNQWHQIVIHIPFNKTSTIVLVPSRNNTPPAIQKLANNLWQISGNNYVDTLFTGDAKADSPSGPIDFHGALGLLRTSGADWSFTLCNGTSVMLNGKQVVNAIPTTIFADGHRIEFDNQEVRSSR